MKINHIVIHANGRSRYILPWDDRLADFPNSLNRKQTLLWLRSHLFSEKVSSLYVQFSDGATAFVTSDRFTCQLTMDFKSSSK